MGHGLHAAATMGRLRTAVRTLAGLDLPPDELLQRINDLADDFVQSRTTPSSPPASTPSTTPRPAVAASPRPGIRRPLLLRRGGRREPGGRTLDLPSGAPLGVGGVPFEAFELEVRGGSVLILYTDGLIEIRGEDISRRHRRLCRCSRAAPSRTTPRPRPRWRRPATSVIDDLESRTASEPDDDVALVMAKLGGLPQGSAASWTFPAESYAVRRAREVVRRTLREWELESLEDACVLLVSELVTNSMRYAHGPVGVRMVRGSSLLVEVSDPLPDPPRERSALPDDEGGRGIRLVREGGPPLGHAARAHGQDRLVRTAPALRAVGHLPGSVRQLHREVRALSEGVRACSGSRTAVRRFRFAPRPERALAQKGSNGRSRVRSPCPCGRQGECTEV